MDNRAIVAVWGESKFPLSDGRKSYVGVAELAEFGFMRVEIQLLSGVREFPKYPYMVTVNCGLSMVEMRQGKYPLLVLSEWQDIDDTLYTH